jgi:hypothetical protein
MTEIWICSNGYNEHNIFIFDLINVILSHSDYMIQLLSSWILIHRPDFYSKQCFGDWSLPPSSGKNPTHFGPIDRANPHLPEQVSFLEDGSRIPSPKPCFK